MASSFSSFALVFSLFSSAFFVPLAPDLLSDARRSLLRARGKELRDRAHRRPNKTPHPLDQSKQTLMATPPAAAKATTAEARERGVLARAALLRGNGEWISSTGLAQRKAYLAAKVRDFFPSISFLFLFVPTISAQPRPLSKKKK